MPLLDRSYLLMVATLLQAFAASVLLILAPLAMCMGVPFPTGMMRLADTREEAIPWAWAINGFASVVGAVLATLLAIHLGFAAVILLAILTYTVACMAWRAFPRTR